MPRKQNPESAQLETPMPIKPENVRISVSIPVKEIKKESLITIEKQGKKPSRQEAKKDSILIITEKPQAALKIASALGSPRKYVESGVPYYELQRDGKKLIVACAVGHLFTLAQKKRGGGWPVFDIHWVPSWKKNTKSDFTKKYYSVLEKLAKQAESFIVATDFDVEGEVIGWNIVRFICKQENAKRMKFSSLTKPELEESFNHPLQSIEFGQAIAGETRHFLDWFYGINLSRALMSAIKSAGAFKILSIGRVQGPALKLIVDKERQIISFKPETYWQVFITLQGVELKHNKEITKKAELEKFTSLKGKKADVQTAVEEQSLPPPFPFDLTALQMESYRLFGFTPARTLQLAQSLYLAGLISYPRTSSQKIPSAINPLSIIQRLSGDFNTSLCTRKMPVEGKKSDPAHPSIYPTGESGNTSTEEFKIYSLIVKRFLACFCDNAILENKKISAAVDGLLFTARATTIKKKAWLSIYPASIQEATLPTLNGQYEIEAVRTEEKETQPPRRYSPASIISELEKRNLGTKATRSSILDTLYTRGYIEGTSIKATPLGIALVSTLEENSGIILDEALTREFEKEMDSLHIIKKNLPEKEKEIIKKAESTIEKIAEQFKKSENKIGVALLTATTALREAQKKDAELMLCPVCKKGQLAITFSRKTKRQFVACNAYPNCKTTFSLPPNGMIKKTGKLCECSFPKLIRISSGKRPWVFCFNPTCKTKQEKEGSAKDNYPQ